MFGDEFLDVIDSDGLVNGATGAVLFASVVADASTDRGEGVLVLDEGESFLITSFRGHFDVALDTDMSWAPGFARSRSGFGDDVFAMETVIGIHDRFLRGVGGKRGLEMHLDGAFFFEFHAKTNRVDRAIFDAFAASDAIGSRDFATIVRSGSLADFEFLDGAEAKASAATAIADGRCFAIFNAFDIRDGMHEALLFAAMDDFLGFFAGDSTVFACADEVFGGFAKLHATIIGHVAAAFAHFGAANAARAASDGEIIVFIKIIGKRIARIGSLSLRKSAFDRDDAHQAIAVGEHRTHGLHAVVGISIEGAADFRMVLGVG